MLIRPATLDDTEARVQVHNASRPDNQITLETALHSEKVRKPELVFQRFAAEIDGEPSLLLIIVSSSGCFTRKNLTWAF
jgi:hypothetical protein